MRSAFYSGDAALSAAENNVSLSDIGVLHPSYDGSMPVCEFLPRPLLDNETQKKFNLSFGLPSTSYTLALCRSVSRKQIASGTDGASNFARRAARVLAQKHIGPFSTTPLQEQSKAKPLTVMPLACTARLRLLLP